MIKRSWFKNMLPIPENVLAQFNNVLQQRAIHESFRPHYRKWLRYFLDFRRKYPPPDTKSEQIRLFIKKLQSKKQTPQQCTQAAHALSLFFESQQPEKFSHPAITQVKPRPHTLLSNQPLKARNTKDTVANVIRVSTHPATAIAEPSSSFGSSGGKKRYNGWRCLEKSKSPEVVSELHDKDLAAGYAGVFLVDSLEKKYPAAAKDFIWQWFFPQKELTLIPGTKERRRYHLHESQVQGVLKKAARKAKLTKRVKSHTFRHSFATHLLQTNYDIRTIQTMLGHADVRTTMIYTHCVPSKTAKEAKSPLDF